MCEVVNNAYEQKELRIVVGEPNPPTEMNFKQTPLSVQEVEFAGTLGLSNPKISPDGISFDLEAFSMHRPAGVEMQTVEGEVDEVNEDGSITTRVMHRLTITAETNDMCKRVFRIHIDTHATDRIGPKVIDCRYAGCTLSDLFGLINRTYENNRSQPGYPAGVWRGLQL